MKGLYGVAVHFRSIYLPGCPSPFCLLLENCLLRFQGMNFAARLPFRLFSLRRQLWGIEHFEANVLWMVHDQKVLNWGQVTVSVWIALVEQRAASQWPSRLRGHRACTDTRKASGMSPIDSSRLRIKPLVVMIHSN